MAEDIKSYCTPEDMLVVDPSLPKEVPTDALHASLARAKAMVLLISSQFEEPDGRLNDTIIMNGLWALEGELKLTEKLVDHGSEAVWLNRKANTEAQPKDL